MSLELVGKANPAKSTEDVRGHIGYEGKTLAEIFEGLPHTAIIYVNGRKVQPAQWEEFIPKDGSQVVVTANIEDNDTLRIVAFIVVAILAAYTGGAAAGLLGLEAGTFGYAVVSVVVSSAVIVAGAYAINKLIPPVQPDGPDSRDTNRLPGLANATNDIDPYAPLPVPYGQFRWVPPLAAKAYTELVGNEQYLNMILCLGYGPFTIDGQFVDGSNTITNITSDAVRIEKTGLPSYTDWEIEIGTYDNLSLFRNSIVEQNPAYELKVQGSAEGNGAIVTDNVSGVFTTSANAKAFSVDITFPTGMFTMGSDGQTNPRQVETCTSDPDNPDDPYDNPNITCTVIDVTFVDFTIEFCPAGTADYASYPTINKRVWGPKKETIRAGVYQNLPSTGQWDIRVTRVQSGVADSEVVVMDAAVTAVRSILDSNVWNDDEAILLALRIKATDQLSRRVDKVDVFTEKHIRVWDGSAFTTQISTNPAWAFLDAMTGTQCPNPISDNSIQLDELLDFANDCDSKGLEFNWVFRNDQVITKRWSEILASGGGAWALQDGQFTVIWDKSLAQMSRAQLMTARNAANVVNSKSFLNLPHGLKVSYVDPNSWSETEGTVYRYNTDTGVRYDASNATRLEEFKTVGVTSWDQAWKLGEFHYRQSILRPEAFQLEQDMQSLVVTRGSWVMFQEDSVLVGQKAGRVTSMVTDVNGDATELYLDEKVTMTAGESYNVRIQRNNNTYPVEGVANTQDTTNHLMLDAPVPDVTVGDLVVFGIAGKEIIDCKVTELRPNPDMSARMTLVPAAFDIWDLETPPVYDPGITEPDTNPEFLKPPVPTVLYVRSNGETHIRDDDGALRPSMVVAYAIPSSEAPVSRIEARYRWEGTDNWVYVDVPAERGSIRFTDLEVGDVVEYQLRAWTPYNRFSDWTALDLARVGGRPTAPPSITALATETRPEAIKLSWDNPDAPDIRWIEIYGSETNDRATASRVALVNAEETTVYADKGTIMYFWGRVLANTRSGSNNVSAWFPANATGGIQGTAGGASVDFQDVQEFVGYIRNGFETGEFGLWNENSVGGNTLSADTTAYVGSQAGLFQSSNAAAGQGDGAQLAAPDPIRADLMGSRLRVQCFARQPAAGAASEFAIALNWGTGWSGWQTFTPTGSYQQFGFLVDVPDGVTSLRIEVWGDTAGAGNGTLVDAIAAYIVPDQITASNIDSWIATAAIGDAYITNLSAVKLIADSAIVNRIFVGNNGNVELGGDTDTIEVIDNQTSPQLRVLMGDLGGVGDTEYGLEVYDQNGVVIFSSGRTFDHSLVDVLQTQNAPAQAGADVTDYTDTRIANAIRENGITTIYRPIGGTKEYNGNPTTGAIVVTLPQAWTSTMLRFAIDVYEYAADRSFTLLVAGYNYAGSSTWNNTSAQLIGNTGANNRVRFGFDGSKCCIVVGDTTSNWFYAKIAVRDLTAGHNNDSIANWESGWNVQILADLTGYSFDRSISDSLLDARAVLNQGALATEDQADWSTQIAGVGKPDDNADVTGDNTAAAIVGQGDLALENQADWLTQVVGADKPEDNATVGAQLGLNLTDSGATVVGESDFLAAFNKLTGGNIATFISTAAITAAYIGSLNADVINAGTVTGRTLQTATSGKRFVVSSADGEAHFYGDRGDGVVEEIMTLGVSGGGDIWGIIAGSANFTQGGIARLWNNHDVLATIAVINDGEGTALTARRGGNGKTTGAVKATADGAGPALYLVQDGANAITAVFEPNASLNPNVPGSSQNPPAGRAGAFVGADKSLWYNNDGNWGRLDHDASYDDVGTFAFLGLNGGYGQFGSPTSVATGATIAGSNLNFAGMRSNGTVVTGSPTPAGTWRCLGQFSDSESYGCVSLFRRIA